MILNTVSFSMQMTGPADCGNVGISEIPFRNAVAWAPVNTTDHGRVDGFKSDEDPYPVTATMPVEGIERRELVLLVLTLNAVPNATTTATARSSSDFRDLPLAPILKVFINLDHKRTIQSMDDVRPEGFHQVQLALSASKIS